ncbi:MAG: DUF393 domain-containing protein [Pseudomonadota bacterium]
MSGIDVNEGGAPDDVAASPATDAVDRSAEAVFYDGGCPICSREIAMYRAMPGGEAIDWVDVATAPDAALPEGQDRTDLMRRFTVRTRDGALEDGAAGFIALWRGIERMRWLAHLVDRWPLRQLAELGYRAFLLARPLWRGRTP